MFCIKKFYFFNISFSSHDTAKTSATHMLNLECINSHTELSSVSNVHAHVFVALGFEIMVRVSVVATEHVEI